MTLRRYERKCAAKIRNSGCVTVVVTYTGTLVPRSSSKLIDGFRSGNVGMGFRNAFRLDQLVKIIVASEFDRISLSLTFIGFEISHIVSNNHISDGEKIT